MYRGLWPCKLRTTGAEEMLKGPEVACFEVFSTFLAILGLK
jgi:hypothetical protein